MKIIGGKSRGLKLYGPKNNRTRPMNSKAKEAIFNIIQNSIQDATILDLFAGTGSLGLEALSRGAKNCIFVENSSIAVDILKKNIEKANYKQCSKVIATNVFKTLSVLEDKNIDLIFFDPPYSYIDKPKTKNDSINFLKQLITKIKTKEINIIFHYRKNAMGKELISEPLQISDIRTYGTTEIMFIKKCPVV